MNLCGHFPLGDFKHSKTEWTLLAQEKNVDLCGHFPLSDFKHNKTEQTFTCTITRKKVNLCGHFSLVDFLSITKLSGLLLAHEKEKKEKYLQPFYTMILAGPMLMHLQLSS